VIIKDFARTSNGDCTFTFEVTDEEANVLIEFAIRQLISLGALQLEDQKDIQEELDFFTDNGGKLQ